LFFLPFHPKIKAMELVAQCETEKRGIYAGAVGYVGFGGVIDTAIAIRTMVIKNGVAYLQAGGGITYDSVPYDEYVETVNKLGSTVRAVEQTTSRVAKKDGSAPEAKRQKVEE
jgi:anthranilate synthase component 1